MYDNHFSTSTLHVMASGFSILALKFRQTWAFCTKNAGLAYMVHHYGHKVDFVADRVVYIGQRVLVQINSRPLRNAATEPD